MTTTLVPISVYLWRMWLCPMVKLKAPGNVGVVLFQRYCQTTLNSKYHSAIIKTFIRGSTCHRVSQVLDALHTCTLSLTYKYEPADHKIDEVNQLMDLLHGVIAGKWSVLARRQRHRSLIDHLITLINKVADRSLLMVTKVAIPTSLLLTDEHLHVKFGTYEVPH